MDFIMAVRCGLMRVVSCRAFAPLDQLVIEHREPTPCGPTDVRVRVTAAGVNFVDGLIVQGLYQIKPPLPFVAGGEIAGVVAEVGGAVTEFAVGDRVMAATLFGGFADEVVIDSRRLLPTPDALTDGQAATFTQSYMTAYFALHHRARMQAGQWALVLGAGGGVGLAAVDVGAAMGLRVIAAASSAAKRDAAMQRGAEATIDTSTQDLKAATRALVKSLGEGADGVDVVYDPVGGDRGEEALRTLREDGQLLVVGFASGRIPQLPANQVLLRNRRVTGVDWGGFAGRNPDVNRQLLMELLAMVAAGALSPAEPTTYPLTDAAHAMQQQLDGAVVGKVALVP
jgi:NADPH2:quinone reductase